MSMANPSPEDVQRSMREAIRAQVKALDLPHRTARYRDDRGVRYFRKSEGSADPANRRAASVDHTLSQPTHVRRPPAHICGPGAASLNQQMP